MYICWGHVLKNVFPDRGVWSKMVGNHCTIAWFLLVAKELPVKQSEVNFSLQKPVMDQKIGSPHIAFFPYPQIPRLKDHVYLVHTLSFILSEEKLESFDSGGGCSVTTIDT